MLKYKLYAYKFSFITVLCNRGNSGSYWVHSFRAGMLRLIVSEMSPDNKGVYLHLPFATA